MGMKGLPKITTAKSLVGTLFAVALVAWSPLQTRADTIGFSISGGTEAVTVANLTLGYAFTVSSPISVTMFGLFDSNNDGLSLSHDVTIWTSTGTQLRQATIPSGTVGTLTNGFRYVSIAPLTLGPGTYTIGGFYAPSFSDTAVVRASITSASGLSYVASRSAAGFTFPTGDIFNFPNSYFGPNFQFTTPGVPDGGSTVMLLGAALGALGMARRFLKI
jgi:hypothetical protein